MIYVPKVTDKVRMSDVVFREEDIHISFSLFDELFFGSLVSLQSNWYGPVE